MSVKVEFLDFFSNISYESQYYLPWFNDKMVMEKHSYFNFIVFSITLVFKENNLPIYLD